MATAYKILGQVSPAADSANTVYNVPASTSAVISTINICNLDTVARNYRIAAVKSGEAISNKNYIAYEVGIAGKDSVALTMGITLASNDSIIVQASGTSNLAFSIFGSEIV